MELSPETLQFIKEHLQDNVRNLALQALRYPAVDMPAAIVQIAGRQATAEKIPSWQAVDGLLYPRHLSLEQCSSEVTACYKASLVQGESITDLTGGFGIDCAFMAPGFREVAYIERQSELCEIAAHNFPLLGLNQITVYNEDSIDHLRRMERMDWIFIDPARRNEHGGKTIAISDCEPDVAELEELLLQKAGQVMIKLSPMLDLSLAIRDMRHVREAHILSANNECKELLLIIGSEPTEAIPIHCMNLSPRGTQRFLFTREQEQEAICAYTNEVGTYLYEPNASILKAGAFRCLATRFGLGKLHPNSHLYTSDELIADFPGRTFEVASICSFNKKEIKEALGEIKKANITVRNFPTSVAELRKRTRLAEGGDVYLFATTLANEQKVLIRCRKKLILTQH